MSCNNALPSTYLTLLACTENPEAQNCMYRNGHLTRKDSQQKLFRLERIHIWCLTCPFIFEWMLIQQYIYANIYVHKEKHDVKHVLVDCCISAQQVKVASQIIKTDVLEYNQPLIAGGDNLCSKKWCQLTSNFTLYLFCCFSQLSCSTICNAYLVDVPCADKCPSSRLSQCTTLSFILPAWVWLWCRW